MALSKVSVTERPYSWIRKIGNLNRIYQRLYSNLKTLCVDIATTVKMYVEIAFKCTWGFYHLKYGDCLKHSCFLKKYRDQTGLTFIIEAR